MKAFKRFALCAVVICVCTAQTPAPAPAPVIAVPFKAARHLEYAFAVSYVTSGEGHAGEIGSDGSGVQSYQGTGGRRGTIDVDVSAYTSDGGLVVGVNEMLQSAARPEQRFTCVVYGDGHTTCPAEAAPLSDAESALLSFLGRGVVDSKKMDAQNHWRRTYSGKQINVVSDFTVADAPEGQPVTIVEKTNIHSDVPSVGNTVAEAKVVYDLTMAVPDSLHKEAKETYGSGSLQTTIDMQLTTDSFARRNQASEHRR